MSITSGLCFRWPWRAYQARVLELLDGHLSDKRLHVVAAPGSGKTVLGLEVFRRLGVPTVVLSPTRTIRDQWIDRLGDFLPDAADPSGLAWQSRSLGRLQFFNSLTYQALHARARLATDGAEVGEVAEPDAEVVEATELDAEASDDVPGENEIRTVAECLKAAGIRLLILDEAHHLRAEWWSALQGIVRQLDDVILVSLTGTPPYDVVGQQWGRYIELCGPIDEEISVPELVKAGTLCAHQDYIWLVRCEGREAEQLRQHRAQVVRLLAELTNDADLQADCRAHGWVANPTGNVAELIEMPREAMALCAYMHGAGATPASLMQAADLSASDLPPMMEGEFESLLSLYLFGPGWPDTPDCKERRERLGRRLRADGLLQRRKLAIADGGQRWPRLALNAAKADACLEIHRLECEVRGDSLRQVILTDFIRDEEYQRPVQGALSLGAWPVFFRLAQGASPGRRRGLALHTGRLSIVHRDLLDALGALPECSELHVCSVPALDDFVEVRAQGERRLTAPLTRLLADGRVQVLVGTRALLGEGWDAPPVNSLILASVIGAFMTTNQMRGRAIRTDPLQPGKIASIWHIGAFAQLDADYFDLRDLSDMHARFETFVGLAHARPVIEGGLERLRPRFISRGEVALPIDEARANREMSARLREQGDVARGWREAVEKGVIGQVVRSVDVPAPPRFNPLDFLGTLGALLLQLVWIALGAFAATLQGLARGTHEFAQLVTAIVIATVVAFVVTAPRLVRVAILYLRYLPVDGAVRGISLAVRDALCETDLLPANLRHVGILVSERAGGGFQIALGDGTLAERTLFADCVSEVLGPIERPRYLITRRLARRVGRELDTHAVPGVLGARAEYAAVFLAAWHRHVSPGELLYTRSDAGRIALAGARLRSFAPASKAIAKRMDRWV